MYEIEHFLNAAEQFQNRTFYKTRLTALKPSLLKKSPKMDIQSNIYEMLYNHDKIAQPIKIA